MNSKKGLCECVKNSALTIISTFFSHLKDLNAIQKKFIYNKQKENAEAHPRFNDIH